jgi:UDP-N-acetyl-alpha-D-muramoyl-L-alanyl-L-glutamate epimerase
MGLTAHKPFECVGEIEESLVALRLLAQRDEWKDTLIVSALIREAALPSDAEVEATFRGDGPNLVPPVYLAALEGLGAAR